MVSMKQCIDCKGEFSLDNFARHKGSKDGRHYYCLLCHKKRSKINYNIRSVKEGYRYKHIMDTYGLSKEDYEYLLISQNSKCKICFTDLKESWDARSFNGPCVDHCHKTGKIRGILCNHCNRGLGLFRDNPDYLERAKEYIINASK